MYIEESRNIFHEDPSIAIMAVIIILLNTMKLKQIKNPTAKKKVHFARRANLEE